MKQRTKLEMVSYRQFMTAKALAELLNISPHAVELQKKRGISKVCTAKKYAAVLNVSPHELIDIN